MISWSEALLAEWERVIVREHGRSAESAARITATIRDHFGEGRVAEPEYTSLVGAMPGSDPDDRRHMAAAVAGRAEVIVTWNVRDFPAPDLERLGISVMDPDTYLCGLLLEMPDEVLSAVARMAARKKRPPMSTADVIDHLAKAGVSGFAARLRDLLDMTATQDGQ